MTGLIESHPKDGSPTVQNFASRSVFEEDKDGKLKMKTYEAWGGIFNS